MIVAPTSTRAEPGQPGRPASARRPPTRGPSAGRPGPALALRARRHAGDQRFPGAGAARLAHGARSEPAHGSPRRVPRRVPEEAMRLWPTTAMLSRETTAERRAGRRDHARGYAGRDRQHVQATATAERVTYADRFAPEEWTRGRRAATTGPSTTSAAARRAARARRSRPASASRSSAGCSPLEPRAVSPALDLGDRCRTCSTSSRSASASSRADPAQARRPSRSARSASPRSPLGRLLVLGAGELERRLDHRAEQHQGELGDRHVADLAGLARGAQPGLDQPEAVARLDLVPRLPAEHGGSVDQGDPLDLGLEAEVEELVDRRRAGRARGPRRSRPEKSKLRDELGLDLARRPRRTGPRLPSKWW